MEKRESHNPEGFLTGEFNLPKIEEKILEFWKANQIFEKSLEARKGKKPFVFYEGPPYANGKPGIHHVLARIFKDIILRYKTMAGFLVPRRAGWDTHGLPVEIAAEKALGITSKSEIEKMGIGLFNKKAKESVWIYKDEWERMTTRIGYWLDLKNAYVTYRPRYIETIWWILKRIWERKLLYKGHKVVSWCPRCGTALSSHELAQGYQEVVDQSVYMKFKLKKGQKIGNFTTDDRTYILSWTTTPWTLPGNVALAVGNTIQYVETEKEGDKLWYAEDSPLAKDLGNVGKKVKGSELVGLRYEPLFEIPSLRNENAYKIYPADFVTTTDGTGVVHTAVMYGEDDYKLGVKVGLPQHHTVDENGKFTKEVKGFAGLPVKAKKTDEKIFEYLKKKNYLFSTSPYTHEYPFCWRCGTATIYYARTSWFIEMSKLREKLLANNKKIHWVPEHLKEGRFGEWLKEVKDWNLSRERYWGAPLPIWECAKCEHTELVGGAEELFTKTGKPKNEYWVMRHGESETQLLHLIDSGQKQYHLTTIGKSQVKETAERLIKENIDLLFASDVQRTKETAEIVAPILGIKKIVFDPRLREIHLGALSGCHSSEYHALFPTHELRFEKRPENGESLRDLRTRLWDLLEEFEKKYEGKKILLISHEYPIWMLFHTAEAWSEEEAIEKKGVIEEDFVRVGEVRKLNLKKAPRNDTGEIDFHRPYIDGITFPCAKCGNEMRRVKEVADVWFDSGAMPFAQSHYPFEHKELIDKHIAFPADYIAEGIDQTRGWFYTLLAIATALGYEAPYRNVVSLGLINDKHGQKMSKSKGNIVEPFAVIDKYGVDAVRWYFYTVNPPGEPKNFDEGELLKAFRRFHLIVYNSLVFFKTYGTSFKGSAPEKGTVLDEWILARLAETEEAVTKNLDAYEIRDAALALEAFADDLSRWYIRRSRRRLQKPESDADYRAASSTLGFVLRTLCLLAAPFTPFFAEALYRNFEKRGSVHLTNWPKLSKNFKNKNLTEQMKTLRQIASAALAKRAELGIKVKQPLAELRIADIKSPYRVFGSGRNILEKTTLQKKNSLKKENLVGVIAHDVSIIMKNNALLKILKDEVNVKAVILSKGFSEEIDFDRVITPELRGEGILREIVRLVQDLRQEAGFTPKDLIVLMVEMPKQIAEVIGKHEAFLKQETNVKEIQYRKSQKFDAEIESKIGGASFWLGVRKI